MAVPETAARTRLIPGSSCGQKDDGETPYNIEDTVPPTLREAVLFPGCVVIVRVSLALIPALNTKDMVLP